MDIINFKSYVKKNNFFDISLLSDNENEFKDLMTEFNSFIEKNHFIGYPEKFKFSYRIFLSYILYLSENDKSDNDIKFLSNLKILRMDSGNKIFEINYAYDYLCSTNVVFNDLSFYMLSNSLILNVIQLLDQNFDFSFNFKEISNFISENKDKINKKHLKKMFKNNIFEGRMILNIFMCPEYLLSLKQKDLNEIICHNAKSSNFIHLLYSSKYALRYVLNEFDFYQHTNRYIKTIFKCIIKNDIVNFDTQYYIVNTINAKMDKYISIPYAEKDRVKTIWHSLFLSFIDDICYNNNDINHNQYIAIKHYLKSYNFKSTNSYIKNSIIDKLSKKINALNLTSEIILNDLNFILLINNNKCFNQNFKNYLIFNNINSKSELLILLYNVCNNNEEFLTSLYSDKYLKTKKIDINLELLIHEKEEKVEGLAKIRDLLNSENMEKYLNLTSINLQIDHLIKSNLNIEKNNIKIKKRI